jgi:hypothetical protein
MWKEMLGKLEEKKPQGRRWEVIIKIQLKKWDERAYLDWSVSGMENWRLMVFQLPQNAVNFLNSSGVISSSRTLLHGVSTLASE